MKESTKLVFDINIITKNGDIFCVYLWIYHKVSAILTSTGTQTKV